MCIRVSISTFRFLFQAILLKTKNPMVIREIILCILKMLQSDSQISPEISKAYQIQETIHLHQLTKVRLIGIMGKIQLLICQLKYIALVLQRFNNFRSIFCSNYCILLMKCSMKHLAHQYELTQLRHHFPHDVSTFE